MQMYLYVISFLPHLVLVLLYIYSIISFTRYSSSYIYILYTFYLLVRFSYFKIYNCIIFYICMNSMCFVFSPLNFFGYWTLNKYYYYYYYHYTIIMFLIYILYILFRMDDVFSVSLFCVFFPCKCLPAFLNV